MPFPLIAVAGAAVSAVVGAAATVATVAGTVVTLGLASGGLATVIGGAALLAGGLAAIGYNEEKRKQAEEAARREASRERERILLEEKRESDRKLKELEAKYGDKIPEEKLKPVVGERVVTLSKIKGNSMGLRDQGLDVSDEAAAAETELADFMKNAELKK